MMVRKKPSPDEFERELREDFPRGLFSEQVDAPVNARWADLNECTAGKWAWGFERGQLYLGERGGKLVGRFDDRHQTTIGGSRTGKGVSLIVPVLLTYQGSCICIDVKGELARDTSGPRQKHIGANTIVLDPFDTTKLGSHCFNPLAEIPRHLPDAGDELYPTGIEDAAWISESLIVQSSNESYWTDAARILVQALILMALLDEAPSEGNDGRQNLLTVRDMLTLRDSAIRAQAIADADEGERPNLELGLFSLMQAIEYRDVFGGFISGVGAQFESMGEKERGAVLSTARTQTAFLDSAKLRATLTRSDFKLEDVKLKNLTVYLCLPASRLGAYSRWLRNIITMALQTCERVEQKPSLPVLFVLDEAFVLGHVDVIEKAAGHMAGYGVRLWSIWQDIGQMKDTYKGTWETFFGNSACVTFHGISDASTLDYLSKMLGNRTFAAKRDAALNHTAQARGELGVQDAVQHQPLAAPHELAIALARERGRLIVLYPGSRPLILQRAIYYEDPQFMELLR